MKSVDETSAATPSNGRLAGRPLQKDFIGQLLRGFASPLSSSETASSANDCGEVDASEAVSVINLAPLGSENALNEGSSHLIAMTRAPASAQLGDPLARPIQSLNKCLERRNDYCALVNNCPCGADAWRNRHEPRSPPRC